MVRSVEAPEEYACLPRRNWCLHKDRTRGPVKAYKSRSRRRETTVSRLTVKKSSAGSHKLTHSRMSLANPVQAAQRS